HLRDRELHRRHAHGGGDPGRGQRRVRADRAGGRLRIHRGPGQGGSDRVPAVRAPEAAAEYWRRGLEAQMSGDLEAAIELYRRSLAACPTAEAHTFLGWTYSFQGRLEDAIGEAQEAIARAPASG